MPYRHAGGPSDISDCLTMEYDARGEMRRVAYTRDNGRNVLLIDEYFSLGIDAFKVNDSRELVFYLRIMLCGTPKLVWG